MRTLGLLASQYLQLEMNRKALDYLDIADKIGRTGVLPDSIRYMRGNIYLLKGLVYKHNHNCDFATDLFNKAITEFSIHSKNKAARANIGQAYSQKAFCEFERTQYDSATVSFNKAIEAGNLSGSNSIIAGSLAGLAKISLVKNQNTEAVAYLNKALTYTEKSNIAGLTSDIYKELTLNYLALNDLTNHQKYVQLYNAAKTALEDKELKTLNRDLKNTSLQTEAVFIQQRNNYIFGTVVLLVFILSFTAFIIYRTRIQRKKVKEMHQDILNDK
jgi:tetratricopeptide (TPR) repeat protein